MRLAITATLALLSSAVLVLAFPNQAHKAAVKHKRARRGRALCGTRHGPGNLNALSTLSQSPARPAQGCFPSLNFPMPDSVPSNLDDWWCDANTEYAFMGFSYGVTPCQGLDQIKREFKDIRTRFNGRYIRMYGFCDRPGFYNDIVEAAWEAGVGVQALIWFGFDGGNAWVGRRDALFATLRSNPKARFVTRAVQFGSEPLYDSAIAAGALASEVRNAKGALADLRIPVTISEMRYGYQKLDAPTAGTVLDAIDLVDMHMQPFFSGALSTPAAGAWPLVSNDIGWFFDKTGGKKKVILSQNGWPTQMASNISPNSDFGRANSWSLANVQNQQDYYDMLDAHCADFKNMPGGGVGWFAHMYSDSQDVPGHGLYDQGGNLKIRFNPRTAC